MIRLIALLALLAPMAVSSQDDAPTEAEWMAAAEAFMGQLDKRDGHIALPAGNASLDVPPGFHYLDESDAEAVLVDLWGNPPGTRVLGMIIPAGVNLLDAESWAVVIQYEEEGYVSDENAAEIDYDDLLEEMQQGTRTENEDRVAMGYGAIDLVGWAQPPHYDPASNKLYWAKELYFEGADQNTLNYNIRVLGRHGVLVLNAVANMDQLPDIEQRMPEVLAFTNFDEGFQYDDFDPDYDQVAAYGLGALVAGKVAAKTGLLAKLGVLLLALKKYLILIVVVVAGLFGKLFKRKDPAAPAGE